MNKHLTAVAVLLAAAASPALAGEVPQYVGVRVIDGDTIVAGAEDRHIRLSAIDAPELKQVCSHRDGSVYDCGAAARAALQHLVDEALRRDWPVNCKPDPVTPVDRYGRTLATCYVDPAEQHTYDPGLDLGAAMVRQGWALPYWKYGGARYDAQYREAVAARVGIHAGSFDNPENWRHAIAALKQRGAQDADYDPAPGFTGGGPLLSPLPPSYAPSPSPLYTPLPYPPLSVTEQRIKEREQQNRLLIQEWQRRVLEDALRRHE